MLLNEEAGMMQMEAGNIEARKKFEEAERLVNASERRKLRK
jgi:hypothetical protein